MARQLPTQHPVTSTWDAENGQLLYPSINNGMANLPMLERLEAYSSLQTVMDELVFVKDGYRSILCHRAKNINDCTAVEACLHVAGVVAELNILPFVNEEQTRLQSQWFPPGTQAIAIVGSGHAPFTMAVEAIRNISTMAQAQSMDSFRREVRDVTVNDQLSIVAHTPLGTNENLVKVDDNRLPHDAFHDPSGMVSRWAARQNCIVLEENHVRLYEEVASQPDNFQYKHLSGDTIRPGHVVRLELGFRIIPTNGWLTLNVDLRSITLISKSAVNSLPLPTNNHGSGRIHQTPERTLASDIIVKPRNSYIHAAEQAALSRSRVHQRLEAAKVERRRVLRKAFLFVKANVDAAGNNSVYDVSPEEARYDCSVDS